MHSMKTGASAPTLPEPTRRKIIPMNPNDLEYFGANFPRHSEENISMFAVSIRKFGFGLPVITDGYQAILSGQGRVAAACMRGRCEIPTLPLCWLTEKERRAYLKAMRRYAEYVGWDMAVLRIELQHVNRMQLSDLAMINGRFFRADGTEVPIVDRPT